MKQIKNITTLIVCIISVLWLIPTVFVQTSISEIKSYELIKNGKTEDVYRITYTYKQNGQIKEGTYKDNYGKDFKPLVGEQGTCHYWTIPPYPAFDGDAPSPVLPLILLGIGAFVYVGKYPKFFKKKEKDNESES